MFLHLIIYIYAFQPVIRPAASFVPAKGVFVNEEAFVNKEGYRP